MTARAKTNEGGVRQTFCEEHFKLQKHDVRWFDIVGMVPLNENMRARLELATCDTSASYEGIEIKIVNKTGGEVERKFFLFRDYVTARTDKRNDMPAAQIMVYEHRVYGAGLGSYEFGWHIAVPVLAEFIAAIDNYISSWE